MFILPTILQDSNHLHNLKYLTELLATISNKQFRETGQSKSLTCMLHRETLLDTGVGREGRGVALSGGKGEPPWNTFFQGTQILVPEKCSKGSDFLKGLAIKKLRKNVS